ncbi:HNH endonuclease [Paucibacter sp. R3-3]|uniref:Putative HNH nuclease YajD n=1 Tax=Roseateles agri TaxID=3098619 RepID=A0ABU5DQB3_9BURK|nr:HNH endonuclease [Paucibacter sp. R3-3]MDY0748517.1 HNH endonuclease [Paucibacter sp. R3-3]
MDHKVKPGSFADSRRGSRHERGYGTAWDKLRRQILRRDAGLCQPCLRNGVTTPSCRTVDHVLAKAAGGTDEPSNLQTICTDCHASKTAAEAVQARAGGLPVAPAPEAQTPGGARKSGASSLRTDRLVEFSRAGYQGGGVPPAGTKGGC